MGPLLLSVLLAAAGASGDEAAIVATHESARRAHLTGDADLLASGMAEKFVETGRGRVTERRSFVSSWIQVLEKIDGAWKMVAISSSVAP